MFRLALLLALLVAPLAEAQVRERPRVDDRDRQRGGGDHVDRLARRLEREARELREEVLTHFSGRPGFRDMVGHMQEIERQANRITRLADRDARPRLLRESLHRIDDEVRKMSRHVQELGRVGGIDRRAYEHLREEFQDISRLIQRMHREL